MDYQEALREAESRIAQLTDQLAACQKRADQAENARDKLEFECDECSSDLKVARARIASLEKESEESMRALQQQYIAALATASEKSNRAREAIEERDEMMRRMEEMVVVMSAAEKLAEQAGRAADLQRANEELTAQLEASELARTWMQESMRDAEAVVKSLQAAVDEAQEKAEKACEQEMLRIKGERDFFERLFSDAQKEPTRQTVDGVKVPSVSSSPLDGIVQPAAESPPTWPPRSSAVEGTVGRSPIFPTPAVDPFALLNSCEGAARKMDGDISARFAQLRLLLNRCDLARLGAQTNEIFVATGPWRVCSLCHMSLISSAVMVEHICGPNHIHEMKGAVCADAFAFWWNAVEEATALELRPSFDWFLQFAQYEKEMSTYKEENRRLRDSNERYKSRLRSWDDVDQGIDLCTRAKMAKYRARCDRMSKELDWKGTVIRELHQELRLARMMSPDRERGGKSPVRSRPRRWDVRGEEDNANDGERSAERSVEKASRSPTVTVSDEDEEEDGEEGEEGEEMNLGRGIGLALQLLARSAPEKTAADCGSEENEEEESSPPMPPKPVVVLPASRWDDDDEEEEEKGEEVRRKKSRWDEKPTSSRSPAATDAASPPVVRRRFTEKKID